MLQQIKNNKKIILQSFDFNNQDKKYTLVTISKQMHKLYIVFCMIYFVHMTDIFYV